MSRLTTGALLGSAAGLALGGVAAAGAAREHAYGGPERISPEAAIASYDPAYGRAGKRVLVANLDGRSEIGPDGTPGAGNLVGRGLAAVGVRGGRLCVGIVVLDGGPVVAAHIHEGARGANGPVVVGLPTPAAEEPGSVFGASSAGCLAVAPALVDRIRRSPERFYVNVHTADFRNGALRGQLRSAKPPPGRRK